MLIDKAVGLFVRHPPNCDRVVSSEIPESGGDQNLVRRPDMGIDPFEDIGRTSHCFEVI